MSLLIDVLQEVEQAEQKNNENELDNNDLIHENSSDSSDEWTEEFLPEFAQILEQDSSDAVHSNIESNYYEQAFDEFLDKKNFETAPQNVEMSSPLEKESEIGNFSESEEFILSESLEIESSELEQNLEKSISGRKGTPPGNAETKILRI